MSRGLSTIKLFPWQFIGQINGRRKIEIVYPKEIPAIIQSHLKGDWEVIENRVEKVFSVIKFPFETHLEEWIRPVDFQYMLRDESYHECIQHFSN